MKKNLLLILAALLISSSASAKLFNFGIKAGLNLATVSGMSDVIAGAKPDFTGGLYFELHPLRILGFSIEGLYSAQGFQTKDIQFENGTASLDASLGYIAMPIMAKVYILQGLSLNAGYQPSFLVNSRLSMGNDFESGLTLEPVVHSIPVGISYCFKWGLMLDMRYNIGLSAVNDPMDVSVSDGAERQSLDVKNQVYTLSVGWRF